MDVQFKCFLTRTLPKPFGHVCSSPLLTYLQSFLARIGSTTLTKQTESLGLVEGWLSRFLVGSLVDMTVVALFMVDWGRIVEGAVDTHVVEPPHPVQCCEF